MTDTATPTRVQPTKAGGNGTGKRGPNRVPVRGEAVEAPPERSRKGFWAREFDEVFSKSENHGKTFPYHNVSATAQTTLKQKYGVDATTRTENGETVLYATYDPAKAEEIKRTSLANAAKRSAAAKKNK